MFWGIISIFRLFSISRVRKQIFCKGVISEVAETVGSWMKYADKCGIHKDRATEIAEMLNMTGFVSIRS